MLLIKKKIIKDKIPVKLLFKVLIHGGRLNHKIEIMSVLHHIIYKNYKKVFVDQHHLIQQLTCGTSTADMV